VPLSQAPGSVDFAVVDYITAPITTDPAGADGLCTARFDPPGGSDSWLVDRITVTNTSTAETTCHVYVGTTGLDGLRDLTVVGNNDIADESQPIYVPTGVPLIVQWEGADPGAVGHVNVSYRLVQRVRV